MKSPPKQMLSELPIILRWYWGLTWIIVATLFGVGVGPVFVRLDVRVA